MAVYQITYGNYSFSFASVDVTAGTVYAEDKITQLGTAYSFTVSGFLAGFATTTDFAAAVVQMRCQLNTPRKQFSVRWSEDGISFDTLYSFDNTGDDIQWGPQPGELKLNKFSGGKSALYTWTLKVVAKECYNGSCGLTTRPSDVLATIYRFGFAVDANGFTTRTVSGKLIVTTNSVQRNAQADTFRWLVVNNFPVPKNFKRETQDFEASADGLELTFRFVDVEKMWTLPKPISNGQASWMIRTQAFGYQVDYNLSGRFEAPASVTKATIIDRIYALAQAKFANANGSDVTIILGEATLTEDVYGNAISFSFNANSAGGTDSDSGTTAFAIGLNTIDVPLPGYDGVAQYIGPYGGDGVNINSGVIARAPILYDACTAGGGGGSTSNPGFPLTPSTPSNPGSPNSPGGGTPTTNNGISPGHAEFPYIAVHEQWSYECDNGLRVFQPKQSGTAPIIQQASAPTLRIIQAGYASRAGAPPDIPAPTIGAQGNVESWFISPATSEPIGGTGLSLITIHWRYVMIWASFIGSTDELDIAVPPDPRVEGSLPILLEDLPELVEDLS